MGPLKGLVGATVIVLQQTFTVPPLNIHNIHSTYRNSQHEEIRWQTTNPSEKVIDVCFVVPVSYARLPLFQTVLTNFDPSIPSNRFILQICIARSPGKQIELQRFQFTSESELSQALEGELNSCKYFFLEIRGQINNFCGSGICRKENCDFGIKLCWLFIWRLKFMVFFHASGAEIL